MEEYGVNAEVDLASYAAYIVNANLSADTQRKYLAIAKLFVDYLCDRQMYDVKFFTKVTVIDFSKYLDDSSTRKLYTEKNYHYAAKRYLKYIYAMRGEEVTYSNMVRCSFTMMSDIMPHVYTDDAIEALLSLSEDDERFVEGLSYRKAAALK